jgi:hypothetical protein
MPKTIALAVSFVALLLLGVASSIFLTAGASAEKPYCPGNSCHGAATLALTTSDTSTTATSTTTATSSTTTPSDTTTSGTTTTTVTSATSSTSSSLYWGAWIGSQFTGREAPWDWNAVTAFEQRNAGGKHLSVVQWSSPFSASYCGGNCNFATSTFDSVRQHGVIPFFSWANSGISDGDIAAGNWDSYVTSWATAAKNWGHPFFLRFDWEMNAPWFNWGVGNNGTTAAQFVAAWRHVHDIFTSVGASNVTWVWCPNVDPGGKLASLSSLYPGDGYVDWTCLDGYNGNIPWTSFTNL